MANDVIRSKEAQVVEDMRKTRVDRERADDEREGFFELHQRQKETFSTQADRLDNFETTASITINSIARLRIYVSITDFNLGPFIGHAKLRARQAYLTGTRNWHHHYTIDVADVSIKLTGRSVYIRIMPADAFFFEFAASGNPVIVQTGVADGFLVNTYRACMVGVDVRIINERMRVKPTILKQRRSIYGQELSVIERPFQVQLINEPVAYPDAQFKYGRIRATNILFESFAPAHPWTGVTLRSTDAPFATFGITTVAGPGSTFASRDHSFDVPWQHSSRGSAIRSVYIRGAADWPRASGKQMVHDKDHGSREFGIYVDDFNQFAIFPIGAIEPPSFDPYAQNVPETSIQRIAPVLPSWAYVPTAKAKDYWASNPNVYQWAVDQPETDWKFNHLGTKCAAIVFEREALVYDSTFWNTNANPDQTFTSAKFDTLMSWMSSDTNYIMGFAPNTYNNQRYFIAPGIIELTIDIKLTGPDLHQFTATISVAEIRRPSTSYDSFDPTKSRWALFVDYVHHNQEKKTNTNVTVKAGTLVALDVEYWMQSLGSVGELTNRQNILSVRNVYTNEEVFSAVGAPILAIDLTTLSMVLRLDAYSTISKTVYHINGTPSTLNFPIHHFGAWIVHGGVGKEVLFPENTPDDIKLKLNSYAQLNGRQFLAQKMLGGGWEYVPVTTPNDGWGSSLSAYRDWWAYQKFFWYNDWFARIDPDVWFYGTGYPTQGYVQYKVGTAPGFPSDGNATFKWLNSIGGDHRNLFFCTNPRWGWNQYVARVPFFMAHTSYTTFFTHPNGSYMFWSDIWLYDRNGLPGDYVNATGAGASSEVGQGSGFDYNYDTLAVYDPSLIEHVIFDRVHFEIRVKDQPARTNNTTFLDLYNRAVNAGKLAKTLPDSENLNVLKLNDMRATFIKEIGNDVGQTHLFLDLKMTWQGANWWMREAAYSKSYNTGLVFPRGVGTSGNFNNITTGVYWRTTNYAGAGIAFAPNANRSADTTSWHFRFSNPVIIMEK